MNFTANTVRNGNVLHYSSANSKRLTTSVSAEELFAAVYTFGFASTLRTTLNDLFSRRVPLLLYIASKITALKGVWTRLDHRKAATDRPMHVATKLQATGAD